MRLPQQDVVPLLEQSHPKLLRSFVRFRRATVYVKPSELGRIGSARWHITHWLPNLWIPFFKRSIAAHQIEELRASYIGASDKWLGHHRDHAIGDLDRLLSLYPAFGWRAYAALSFISPFLVLLVVAIVDGLTERVSTLIDVPVIGDASILAIVVIMFIYMITTLWIVDSESSVRRLYDATLKAHVAVTFLLLDDHPTLSNYKRPLSPRIIVGIFSLVSLGIVVLMARATIAVVTSLLDRFAWLEVSRLLAE